jgi:hypothetical protein
MAALELVKRGLACLFSDGLFATLRKALDYIHPHQRARQKLHADMLSARQKLHAKVLDEGTAKQRFTAIYKNNLWCSEESLSGPGSNLSYTKNLRKSLPKIFKKYQIECILDAPCGDFHWMKEVLKGHHRLRYIGGDIVEELINKNRASFVNSNISFEVIDITKDALPPADLMIVRDCLFHLSYADIDLVLENLSHSQIKYLLTTTHIFDSPHVNTDIVTGDFRLIDIFSEPFCFPMYPIERIDDWLPPDTPRQMCLFEVATLPNRTSRRLQARYPQAAAFEDE